MSGVHHDDSDDESSFVSRAAQGVANAARSAQQLISDRQAAARQAAEARNIEARQRRMLEEARAAARAREQENARVRAEAERARRQAAGDTERLREARLEAAEQRLVDSMENLAVREERAAAAHEETQESRSAWLVARNIANLHNIEDFTEFFGIVKNSEGKNVVTRNEDKLYDYLGTILQGLPLKADDILEYNSSTQSDALQTSISTAGLQTVQAYYTLLAPALQAAIAAREGRSEQAAVSSSSSSSSSVSPSRIEAPVSAQEAETLRALQAAETDILNKINGYITQIRGTQAVDLRIARDRERQGECVIKVLFQDNAAAKKFAKHCAKSADVPKICQGNMVVMGYKRAEYFYNTKLSDPVFVATQYPEIKRAFNVFHQSVRRQVDAPRGSNAQAGSAGPSLAGFFAAVRRPQLPALNLYKPKFRAADLNIDAIQSAVIALNANMQFIEEEKGNPPRPRPDIANALETLISYRGERGGVYPTDISQISDARHRNAALVLSETGASLYMFLLDPGAICQHKARTAEQRDAVREFVKTYVSGYKQAFMDHPSNSFDDLGTQLQDKVMNEFISTGARLPPPGDGGGRR